MGRLVQVNQEGSQRLAPPTALHCSNSMSFCRMDDQPRETRRVWHLELSLYLQGQILAGILSSCPQPQNLAINLPYGIPFFPLNSTYPAAQSRAAEPAPWGGSTRSCTNGPSSLHMGTTPSLHLRSCPAVTARAVCLAGGQHESLGGSHSSAASGCLPAGPGRLALEPGCRGPLWPTSGPASQPPSRELLAASLLTGS